ncbi:helix-turn-helix transcriptional regulator [Cupriavidus neocaledonicus]|uniref:DNA-binding response regulator, NarL/FixJ family, contains REC and HTH domains n=1 Tax=Cupriavidus neocaledonicus TaxID=1040979 RepID=A0A375HX68_9BURK|nr:response regulator transcription factor [Cupriavidus neocaledonicus]SOZ37899.1 Putative transcription regulator, LuxR family [Cupriavidus neocaledonicus]SPD61250.1 DNA-binding response regulator, NarL/FixJ family, contains REC and HTH domains [Cupriavidus neocaledonicus]
MATILLIEPHPLLRLGLRHLLAQAHLDGDLLDLDPLAPIDSDLWLNDADLMVYGLPADQAGGWSLLEQLCLRLRPRRVLVLSEHAMPALPEAGVPEPVRGCVPKHCSADALDAAVRLVLAGGECFPASSQPLPVRHAGTEAVAAPVAPAAPGDARVVALRPGVDNAGHDSAAPAAPRQFAAHATAYETPSAGAHLLNITERQYEVLALLARGYPIKTVSRMLNISIATAKTHACTLYQRLHVRNKGEAVYVALQRGATLNWAGPEPAAPPARLPAPVGQAA